MSVHQLTLVMQFFPVVWPWNVWWRNSFQNRWISKSLNEANNDQRLLWHFTMGEGVWINGYDTETKTQSFQWKHSKPPKSKKVQVRFNEKVCVFLFRASWILVTRSNGRSSVLSRSSTPLNRVKQFDLYVRIYGKTIRGSCTTTMHLHTIHRLFVSFWPKTKTFIMIQLQYL